VASAKNGRNDNLTPVPAWNSSLIWSRSLAISGDIDLDNCVSWAETWSDSTIRLAMTARSRDIFSVCPAAARPPRRAGRGGAGAARGRRRGRGLRRGIKHVLPADPAADARADEGVEIDARSAASLRTSGVT
jgi:hypothetical protein